MTEAGRPLPLLASESREFWEGCRRNELLIQRCPDCAALRHYPRPMCPQCNSMQMEWVKAKGRGKLYTWTVVYRAFHPSFSRLPYIVAIVELEEGMRLISNIVDCPPQDLYVGLPLEVIFAKVSEHIVLPLFRPCLGQ